MRFVYLIGPPGVGKSTAAAELRKLAHESQAKDKPVPHIVHSRAKLPWYIELGRVRGEFSGTDALAMDIIDDAEKFLLTHPARRMFAEGDRLANQRFFDAIRMCGYTLDLLYLTLPAEELAARQSQRAAYIGREQNAAWARGRATKADNLAHAHGAFAIDAALPPAQIGGILRDHLNG